MRERACLLKIPGVAGRHARASRSDAGNFVTGFTLGSLSSSRFDSSSSTNVLEIPVSRPFARLKLGYYPLPVEEARNIRSLLISSSSYAAIDPCAGDGTALLEITKGTGADLAAIEIDADRAAAAAQRGIATVHGSAFECKVQLESCSLLYLNPPYDTELGPHSNRKNGVGVSGTLPSLGTNGWCVAVCDPSKRAEFMCATTC